jgi:hypothetical protein
MAGDGTPEGLPLNVRFFPTFTLSEGLGEGRINFISQ